MLVVRVPVAGKNGGSRAAHGIGIGNRRLYGADGIGRVNVSQALCHGRPEINQYEGEGEAGDCRPHREADETAELSHFRILSVNSLFHMARFG